MDRNFINFLNAHFNQFTKYLVTINCVLIKKLNLFIYYSVLQTFSYLSKKVSFSSLNLETRHYEVVSGIDNTEIK